MDELARLTIAGNEPEAELLCGLLREAQIECVHRITDLAFGAGGEIANSGAGPREVLVRSSDLERARTIVDGALGDSGDAEAAEAQWEAEHPGFEAPE